MRFEKLSENKIRITLTLNDLKDKDIDFHDFMSNPLETQDLFLDILNEAKEQIGFNTTNYQIRIEALAMIDGDFVVNITRMSKADNSISTPYTQKKKFKVRRKAVSTKSEQAIYKFESFDDYYFFLQYLSQKKLYKTHLIAKTIAMYFYKDAYYLILNDIDSNNIDILDFYSSIIEFATYVTNSQLLISKIKECGKVIFKDNALKSGLKYFKTNTYKK